jgi:hypothetical protein
MPSFAFIALECSDMASEEITLTTPLNHMVKIRKNLGEMSGTHHLFDEAQIH